MARYYFRLRNVHLDALDEEGLDLPDAAAAHASAVAGIRDFLAHETQKGTIDFRGQVDITDENGVGIETVYFRDAVTVIAP